jgi:SNF2 family DNA or RNA helicase
VLLIPERKAVLVQPSSPKRLLKLMPTAKPVRYKGKRMVAVPHKLDETRVLNNLGVRVPSPMLHQYSWPRHHRIKKPFDAQLDTAGFLSLNNRAFVLNDLGTGKTLSALWAFDYLRELGLAKKLLIVCPLSTMERAWADEIFFNFKHLTYSVLYKTKQQRLRALAQDVDIYIVNHHGAKVVCDELAARSDIDTIVIDEVAQIARNKTDIWKSLNQICNKKGAARRVWGLTATPIPNEPTDAYWQVKLITPERMPGFFRGFRDRTMQQVSQFTWVPRKDALDVVHEVMQPAVRYRRSDCIDLPDTIYMTREVALSPEQERAYKAMEKKLKMQAANGEITAANEGVKAGKLVQIACGRVYDAQGNSQDLPCKDRLNEVVSLLQQSDAKTIVFVPYRAPLEMVAQHLENAGYSVARVHGGVSKNDRDAAFQGFQRSKNPQVLVAQPAAMSHGLTLTAASQIVWYAPVTSAEIYEQANGRITRPGQKHHPVIVHIEGTQIERRIYYRLRHKQKMQNILLEKKVAA